MPCGLTELTDSSDQMVLDATPVKRLRFESWPGAHAFSRKHPMSCWLSTMLVVFAGGMLCNGLLGEPILAPLKNTGQLVVATVVWNNKPGKYQLARHRLLLAGEEKRYEFTLSHPVARPLALVQVQKLSRYVVALGGRNARSRVGDVCCWRVSSHSPANTRCWGRQGPSNTELAASPTTDKRLKISLAVQGQAPLHTV
ncbi:unnamed protein product [Timema podura]|uniref:Uncharacterized protein n=1 Tax=Timema podura TaxID=61482 RepID=A0ABN7NZ59_TIMPD|nr:unnamed protein product [Timema podura]